MKTTHLLLVVSILVGVLVACNNVGPQPTQSPISTSPLSQPVPAASPLPASNVAAFQIERPLTAGASTVRGSGPAGVPVYIADVTFMGEVLGTGTIGTDGKFAITVRPLEASHRVGLALGEMAGTQFKPEQFYTPEFQGPESMQIPQVGFFVDTFMVK